MIIFLSSLAMTAASDTSEVVHVIIGLHHQNPSSTTNNQGNVTLCNHHKLLSKYQKNLDINRKQEPKNATSSDIKKMMFDDDSFFLLSNR